MLKDACNIEAVVPSVDSVFFKYGSPTPQLYNYDEALSNIQDTKVCLRCSGELWVERVGLPRLWYIGLIDGRYLQLTIDSGRNLSFILLTVILHV